MDLPEINFLQVPYFIWNPYIKKEINETMFKIYVLMYQRFRLSNYNNWVNKDNEVYIKYSYNDLEKDLNLSRQCIGENIKKLTEIDFIDKHRQFNQSNIYYLKVQELVREDLKSSLDENVGLVREELHSSLDTSNTNKNTLNNNIKNNNIKKDKLNFKKEIEELEIGIDLKEKLKEWLDYKKEIKSPIKTMRSINSLLKNKEFKNEEHIILSIEQSFMNNYKGIFPTKDYVIKEELVVSDKNNWKEKYRIKGE